LARRAAELRPDRSGYWEVLGKAEYRTGHWQTSLAAFQKAQELQRHPPLDFDQDLYFLAMASWQAGEREQARKWLQKANDWMRVNRPPEYVRKGIAAEANRLVGPEP